MGVLSIGLGYGEREPASDYGNGEGHDDNQLFH